MANSTRPLTNTQVEKAKSKPKEYNLSDGKGLQLRVKPNNSKSWLFNYTRLGSTKRTNMKLGEYPDLKLAPARRLRDEYREQLALGNDPQEYKAEQNRNKAEASENTFQFVADQWFKVKVKKDKLTEDYAEDLYNSLANHVFPKLGKRPIHKITALETKAALEPLHEAMKLETLRRIIQRLNMIMNFAVRNELIAVNKLHGIAEDFQAPPPKKHFPTFKRKEIPVELPKLMEAIEGASIKPVTRFLIEWQLHTMVRPSEAAGARWEEIDFEDKVWNIPGSRMKKKEDHSVMLSSQSLEILEAIKPFSRHREHIFPSDIRPRESANSSTVNMALRRMGYKGKLVAHGMRSIASTILHEKDFDTMVIEMALAHVDKNITRDSYNNAEYIEKRRVMMQFWSNYISKAQKGEVQTGKKHLTIAK